MLLKLFEEGNSSAFLVCLPSVRNQKKFVRSFMALLRKETITLKQLIMLSKDLFPVPVLLAATAANYQSGLERFHCKKLVNATSCINVGSNPDSCSFFFIIKKHALKCKCNYCKDPFNETACIRSDAFMCWHFKEKLSSWQVVLQETFEALDNYLNVMHDICFF